jgi:LPXTG-motif cell wall-anchored protein
MKKTVLALTMIIMLLVFGGTSMLKAQDQPAPKKDTVNMDTHAKPEFYYSTEDEGSMKPEKSNTTTIIIVAAAVIVVGGAAFFLLKKKK